MEEKLASIKVLWRQPDSLALWGIPYKMRADCGQQPYDLWKARQDYVAPKPGHYGPKQVDLSDWVWLGCPGWWGSLSKEEQAAVEEFLVAHKDSVPESPCEWSEV